MKIYLTLSLCLLTLVILSGCQDGAISQSNAGSIQNNANTSTAIEGMYRFKIVEWIYSDADGWIRYIPEGEPIKVRHGTQFELKVERLADQTGKTNEEIPFESVKNLQWRKGINDQIPFEPIRFGSDPTFFRIDDTDDKMIYSIYGEIKIKDATYALRRSFLIENKPPN